MTEMISQVRRRRMFGRIDVWWFSTVVIAAFVLLPVMAIFWMAAFPAENIWPHLLATTLPRYTTNSLVMVVAVGSLAGIIGVGTAWLTATRSFFLCKILQWALLLPLAIPAYIGAYALVDFLEYAGPLQTALRTIFGWKSAADYAFPEIRSRGAAIFVLAFSLYPYVYLLARNAFVEQSSRALEVSRALGCGPFASFWQVGLPLARPAIAAGVAIVMMETLSDFGAVEYFAVQTLTTGIFSVWLDGANAGGAAQIACVILLLVMLLVSLEKFGRRKARFYQTARPDQTTVRPEITGWRGGVTTFICILPVLIGFVMPCLILLSHVVDLPQVWLESDLWQAALTSLIASGTAAILTVVAGLILVYTLRIANRPALRLLLPVTTIGYAAPGAVLGLGILIPFAAIDHLIADGLDGVFGINPGLLLTGSSAAVVFAYCIRFFAISQGSIDSAFGRLSPNLGMAARSLGYPPGRSLIMVQLPLIRGSVLTAGLLIFVDCVKELPATLLLRPFGFDTLATHVYNQASLENITHASPGSLVIISVSIMAVILVARNNGVQGRKF